MARRGRIVIFSDSTNKAAPEWSNFWAFDDSEWNHYFEYREDAIQYARLNRVIVKDMDTDEIIFDSYHESEEEYAE